MNVARLIPHAQDEARDRAVKGAIKAIQSNLRVVDGKCRPDDVLGVIMELAASYAHEQARLSGEGIEYEKHWFGRFAVTVREHADALFKQ